MHSTRSEGDAVDLARAAAAERDQLRHELDAATGRADNAEAYAAALDAGIVELRKRVKKSQARAKRFSDECRDLRKKSPQQRRFMLLGFALYDLLTPSVWMSLLAGSDVHATFTGPMVSDDDAEAWLAMDQRGLDVMGEFVETMGEHAELLRMAVAVRESIDMDEDTVDASGKPKRSQTDQARRNRFAEWCGTEMYGDCGDDDDE